MEMLCQRTFWLVMHYIKKKADLLNISPEQWLLGYIVAIP